MKLGEIFLAVSVICFVSAGFCFAQSRPVQQAGTNQVLPELVVKSSKANTTGGSGYLASGAGTATWTDTPIISTPLSLQVIPQEVIEDQGVSRLKDVYRNSSGVTPVKTEGSGIQFENAYIRGFSQRLYVDGVNFYTCPPIDLAGVRQVEILKGPSSALYGAMEVGGLINAAPRLPEFNSQTTLSGEFGSYDFYRAQLDSTGPVNNNAAYRFSAAYQDSRSFRDFLHDQSVFVAPGLTWNLSDETHLTTWLWYQHLDRPVDNGTPFSYKGQPVGPVTRNLAGTATDQNQPVDDAVMGIHLDHAVSAGLTLREKFTVHYFDSSMDAIRFGSADVSNNIAPYYDASTFDNLEFDLVSDALWHFELGSTKHQLLSGVELSQSDYHYSRLTQTLAPVNIFNPVYPSGPFNKLVPGAAEQQTLTQVGAAFLQDQMDALDNRLHLLVGGRADYVSQFYRAWSNGREYNQHDLGLSGRAGLMYDVLEWMSPYANVGRSFNPNTAGSNLTFDGEPLDPTTGLQYEGGLKFSGFNKRLLLTTAAFQVTKDNVPVRDTNHTGFNLNGGKLRSQGTEVDVTGEITPGLQVIGNYTHTQTRVMESNTLPVGAPFVDIPLNSGSAWMKYTFQTGLLKDFGLGTGVFACEKRAGNNNATFDVPGYARLDAGAWYSHTLSSGQLVKLEVSVCNLLDKTYYESGAGQPGAPLSAISKLSVSF